ncbi:DUF397 domain-containing protein [Actinomadura hibisca]|uniref:DUF397 domain-containing protein n=1 Tax=Actinomadura hibisca TaxID=68565 RepID=UPI0009FBADAF|nr:DUF397 domain-containing protein [Actinomadura hibisca]
MTHPDLSRADWRRSSHSGQNGNCVEVAEANGCVGVRDSKNPSSLPLCLKAQQWSALIQDIKADSRSL